MFLTKRRVALRNTFLLVSLNHCFHCCVHSLAAALWDAIFCAERNTNSLSRFLNSFHQIFPELHFSDPFETCVVFFYISAASSFISCVVRTIAASARSSIYLVNVSAWPDIYVFAAAAERRE